jgi:methionyl-tRNA formyltransferase
VRIAFFGTSAFAAGALERLVREDGIEVAAVVSQPDRPAGRGRRAATPPAVSAARGLGLPVVQEERASERPPPADAGAVVAFGQILRPPLLGAYPLYNLHPSLLPRWRGAAPGERALLAGDAETGVTIHETVEALDAGPIAAQRAFPIRAEDDAGAVYARCAEVAAELLRDVLAQAEPQFEPQPEEGATYAEKIGPADRELDLERPPQELVDRVRALSPHIGARLGDLLVWRARVGEDGAFEPLEVQPAGGKRMAYEAYLRGRR